ncbi:MAG: c-type cytochrome [Bacteroidia bacterium]
MNSGDSSNQRGTNFKTNRVTPYIVIAAIGGIVILFQTFISGCSNDKETVKKNNHDTHSMSVAELFAEEHVWKAPDTASIPADEEGKLIAYGRKLMIHTTHYFGPNGSVSKTHNGLTCQNCHLDAGTRPYGNNLGVVSTTYPRFLPRCGTVLNIAEKVNECFLRSLNGAGIDTAGKEMKGLVAYIEWLGKDVKKGDKFDGSGGITAIKFIDRAADPAKGKIVFEQYCSRCHGTNGEGQFVADVMKDETKQQGGTATAEDLYYYPPLWGNNSFNGVATLYRVSKLAGFIKYNMPYPVDYKNPVLTDEQAWDVAAYVNNSSRPIKDHSEDYACDISKKPFDFPFAPYADNFSEEQHKFGPYTAMPSAMKKH